jgi:hypothetical protein
MVPNCAQKQQKKWGNQIVLRLGDGTHLHLETTKEKEKKRKKGRAEAPLVLRLSDGAHLRLEEKKPKKGRRGVQGSLLSKLGPWCLRNNKKK